MKAVILMATPFTKSLRGGSVGHKMHGGGDLGRERAAVGVEIER